MSRKRSTGPDDASSARETEHPVADDPHHQGTGSRQAGERRPHDDTGLVDPSDDDYEATDDGADEAVDERPATPASSTMMERLSQTFLRPPKPKASQGQRPGDPDTAGLTEAEKRARITRIDATERKLGYGAAALAAAVGLIAFVPFIEKPARTVQKTLAPLHGHVCPNPHVFHYQKVTGKFTCVGQVMYSRSHWVTELLLVLLLALAIYVTVRIARRAPLAFTCLLAGFGLEAIVQTILALPFVFLGGWLVLRAWRVQRYGSPTAKNARDAARGSPAAKTGAPARTASSSARSSPRRSKKSTKKVSPTGRSAPAPNKRYTPKSPPRRKIPPPS